MLKPAALKNVHVPAGIRAASTSSTSWLHPSPHSDAEPGNFLADDEQEQFKFRISALSVIAFDEQKNETIILDNTFLDTHVVVTDARIAFLEKAYSADESPAQYYWMCFRHEWVAQVWYSLAQGPGTHNEIVLVGVCNRDERLGVRVHLSLPVQADPRGAHQAILAASASRHLQTLAPSPQRRAELEALTSGQVELAEMEHYQRAMMPACIAMPEFPGALDLSVEGTVVVDDPLPPPLSSQLPPLQGPDQGISALKAAEHPQPAHYGLSPQQNPSTSISWGPKQMMVVVGIAALVFFMAYQLLVFEEKARTEKALKEIYGLSKAVQDYEEPTRPTEPASPVATSTPEFTPTATPTSQVPAASDPPGKVCATRAEGIFRRAIADDYITSCGFASNALDMLSAKVKVLAGSTQTIEVFSPATNKTFPLNCFHNIDKWECSGAGGIKVFIMFR